jgi:hypothetical protein
MTTGSAFPAGRAPDIPVVAATRAVTGVDHVCPSNAKSVVAEQDVAVQRSVGVTRQRNFGEVMEVRSSA